MVPKSGNKRNKNQHFPPWQHFGGISGQKRDSIPAQHNECETFHWASLAHALDDIVTDIQDNSELKSVMI
jgi:hypothetical protein